MPLLDRVRWRGIQGQNMQFRLAAGVKLSNLQLRRRYVVLPFNYQGTPEDLLMYINSFCMYCIDDDCHPFNNNRLEYHGSISKVVSVSFFSLNRFYIFICFVSKK